MILHQKCQKNARPENRDTLLRLQAAGPSQNELFITETGGPNERTNLSKKWHNSPNNKHKRISETASNSHFSGKFLCWVGTFTFLFFQVKCILRSASLINRINPGVLAQVFPHACRSWLLYDQHSLHEAVPRVRSRVNPFTTLCVSWRCQKIVPSICV